MPYRGLPYLVTGRAETGGRVDPYASGRHALPDRAEGVRYTSAPHADRRRVRSYRASDAVRPPRAHGVRAVAEPAASDVEPARVLVAVMVIAVVALLAAFAGIGIARGVAGFVDGAILGAADLQETPLSTPRSAWEEGTVPELYQVDAQWADRPYGPSTVGGAGAAPLALTMVYVDLTGATSIGPVEVASMAQREGYADQDDATALLGDGAASLGLTARPVEAAELAVRRQLNAGFPVICAIDADAFGEHTAYIVLAEIDEHGRLIIRDPSSVERTERHWDFSEILPEAKALWAYGTAQ